METDTKTHLLIVESCQAILSDKHCSSKRHFLSQCFAVIDNYHVAPKSQTSV